MRGVRLRLPPPCLRFVVFLRAVPFRLPEVRPALPERGLRLAAAPEPDPFRWLAFRVFPVLRVSCPSGCDVLATGFLAPQRSRNASACR